MLKQILALRNQVVAITSNQVSWLMPTPLWFHDRNETFNVLHKSLLYVKLDVVTHYVETGSSQFMRYRFDGNHPFGFSTLALVKAFYSVAVTNRKIGRFYKRPGQVFITVFTIVLTFFLIVAESLAVHTT